MVQNLILFLRLRTRLDKEHKKNTVSGRGLRCKEDFLITVENILFLKKYIDIFRCVGTTRNLDEAKLQIDSFRM